MAETNKKTIPTNFDPTLSKPLFSWQSPEFVVYKKNWKWYLIVLIAAFGLAGVLCWQKQWTGAIMILVAAVVFGIMSELKPKNVKCALYHEGAVINEKVYTFSQFKSFWINGRDFAKLRLLMTGHFGGIVTLPMKDQDYEQIKLFVSKYLPEEPKGEDLIDTINSFLRF